MDPLRATVLAFLLIVLAAGTSPAQLSGIVAIPGDLPSIAAAIDSLNGVGVGPGGVTFDVAAGHVESGSNLLLTDSTSSAGAPLVFRKSGTGANPLIIASPGSSTFTDGIIKVAGTDYLTFDGIDLLDTAVTGGTTVQMEWGYALVKANPGNGCQHVTIRNCMITLVKSNTRSTGIYAANNTAGSTTALTVVAVQGTHSNNRFTGNAVSSVHAGIYLGGFEDPSAPYALYDQENDIGGDAGNIVTDFGGTSSTAYGILTRWQNGLRIANNAVSGGAGQTGSLYGILVSSALNADVEISDNTVSLTPGAAANVYAIQNAAGGTTAAPGTTNRVRIHDNVVENCDLSAMAGGGAYLLYQTGAPADLEMRDNIVRNNTRGGSGLLYLLAQAGNVADTAMVADNLVTGNSSAGSGVVYNLLSSTTAGTVSIVSGNRSRNTTGNGNVFGLSFSGGWRNIASGNEIHALSSTGGVVNGIFHASATADMEAHIAGNLIYDLSAGASGSGVNGVFISSGALIAVINNMISDLRAPGASHPTASCVGVYIAGGGTIGAWYNTVLLKASSTSAAFGTSGIWASTGPTVDLRNNNVVNQSVPGATGTAAAYRRSGTALGTYAAVSNNNNFHAGTPSARHLIYADGANFDSTLAQFQARVAPRDSASVTENPPFVNALVTPFDLHVSPAFPTPLNNGGVPVTSPLAVTTDVDGEPRDVATPDIGADEFASDTVPPAIAHIPLGPTTATTARPVSAFITDPIGVADGVNGPRVYFRKRSDTLWAVDATPIQGDSLYAFLIDYALMGGGIVAPGDTIDYYIAAEDVAGNAGTHPAGGGGASPPGTAPPPVPHSYLIVTDPPECAQIGAPADGDTAVSVFAALSWSPPGSGEPPTGYRIYFGTDNPPTNIENGTDLDTALAYQPAGVLGFSIPYFWKVVPYNTLGGNAIGCPVWSFTTRSAAVPVTFQVNMSVKMREGAFLPDSGDTVAVRGNFNGWNPSAAMTDLDNDSVFAITLAVPGGDTAVYRFAKTLRLGVDVESPPDREFFIPLETPTAIPPDFFDRDGVVNLPEIAIGPAALAFGPVTVGDSLADSILVRNTGNGTLTIFNAAVPPEFSLSGTVPAAIPPSDSAVFVVLFIPSAPGPVSGSLVLTHDAAGSPDTVALSGTGVPPGPSPKFLSLTPAQVFDQNPLKPGKSNKALKRAKPGKPIDPIKNVPNRTNILSEAVAQGAFAPGTSESDSAGGMVIGVSFMDNVGGKWKVKKDSAALRCWVRMSKWDFKKGIGKNHADFQKTLYDKVLLFHDGTPGGLDFTTDGKNKPLLKQQKKLTPKKHDNALLAELVALKVNIGVSQLGTTPSGFGDLIYDNDGSAYDEQSILAIAAKADTMMTYWQAYDSADYAGLYDVVYHLNRAFPGSLPLDTVQFNTYAGTTPLPLVVRGEVELATVPFLKLALPFTATMTPRLNNEVEAPEEFEDEEWEEGEGVPVAAKLYQNYPNPFNPGTMLSFRLLEESRVTIRIYNTLGQQIAELISGEEMEEGYNEVRFSAEGLSSGVYFYRIDVQGIGDEGLRSVLTGKMLLLK